MTIAEQRAFAAGQSLRQESPSLPETDLDAKAEAFALNFMGEPAGRSTVRYDAYEQFRRAKDWFKAGYQQTAQ